MEFKTVLKSWIDNGIPFPYALDGVTKKPSITLLFAYCTFVITLIGNILVYFKPELLTASINSTIIWIVAFIFYRLRTLDKVKINLSEKSIELDGEDEKNPN